MFNSDVAIATAYKTDSKRCTTGKVLTSFSQERQSYLIQTIRAEFLYVRAV